MHITSSVQHAWKAATHLRMSSMQKSIDGVRLCVKCRICVPLTDFISRDDGVCDGHAKEKQGGRRYARCSTCQRLPSEGICDCQHTCECLACWEYNNNIARAAMSQCCRHAICGMCCKEESDLHNKCIYKWLCLCKECAVSRRYGGQGCLLSECPTRGWCAGELDPSCDCENTRECHECRDNREIHQSGLRSGNIIEPKYEENEKCMFSACGVCNGTAEKCAAEDCRWRCICRDCRRLRAQYLQEEKQQK